MMRWGFALAALATLGGCSLVLGDFTVDGGGGDASLDASNDAAPTESGADVGLDAPKDAPPDGAPCGALNQTCCTTNPACSVGACCGPICIDTQSDPKNCGACAHDCGGTSCSNGLCEAQTLASIPGQNAGRIRQTMTDLVWLADDTNAKAEALTCPKAGCTTTTSVFSTPQKSFDLAFDPQSSAVYVSDGSTTLYKCALKVCNNAPAKILFAGSNGFDGLDARGDVYASFAVQPHQLHADGTGDIDLGGGNEGTNSIVAPPQTSFVYWPGFRNIRVGTASTPASGADYWTSTANENTYLLAADTSFVVWAGDAGNGQTIYACAVGSSCTAPKAIAIKQNLGFREGALYIDPATHTVYWAAYGTNQHVDVFSCSANGCNQTPTLVASVSASAPGAVASDPTFVYFDYDSSGSVVLARVHL